VEISLVGPEPVVTGFGRVEIPIGGTVEEAVDTLFRESRFKSKRVVTSVSGQSVVVRYVPMMKMNDADLAQAIRFEADKYLPFDLDEVQLDCQSLSRVSEAAQAESGGAEGEQMTVLLAACKTQAVEGNVQLCHTHGLEPVAVDVDLFALANAWELCGLPDTGDTEIDSAALALVDVGAERTSINVLCGGETCFSREINIGGADMTQAIARRMGVELYEAEAIKRACEGNENDVNGAIAPVLEDLANEISLSLDYVEHHEGVMVQETLLSGGGVLAPGAARYIEQATGRTARTWNPLEGLRVDVDGLDVEELEAWASTLVVALGLASRVRES
ncbi:MAG: type IV pilus assembly protein PilM, partial [Planctomycetota bacterium]